MNQLPNIPESLPLVEYLAASSRQGQRHFLVLVIVFCVIAMFALSVAATWPKQYRSSTLILVSEDNIIRQLMEGRAVPTSISDRAVIAREVLFSRRVMDEILDVGGWLTHNPTQAEREWLATRVQERTRIGSPTENENLIRIEYWDRDPARAKLVTERFAELLMAESAEAKLRESREAYDFISQQVIQYQELLMEAEMRLKRFRDASDDAQPGSSSLVESRIAEVREMIEGLRIDRQELESRKASLERQLAGLDPDTGIRNYQAMLRHRIATLQEELDALLVDLQPRHPDVVRARHQIEDLKIELADSDERESVLRERSGYQDGMLHQDIMRELSTVRSAIAGLDSRIQATESLLQQEIARGRRVSESDLQHTELIRDHNVNQFIYEDLLNRLENARLSMRLDEMGRGLTFIIQEPAREPARPSGPRFTHLAAGGLMAAVFTPLGLLLLFVRLDPRVRSPEAVERVTQLPLLGTVPRYWTRRDRQRFKARLTISVTLVAITLVAYGAVGWTKLAVNA
jgi:polysaccharide chain length determinant protein (PEP-CTERM system associated)